MSLLLVVVLMMINDSCSDQCGVGSLISRSGFSRAMGMEAWRQAVHARNCPDTLLSICQSLFKFLRKVI